MPFGLSTELERVLQKKDVQVHACQKCGYTKWYLAQGGDCICANCGMVPATIATVPLMVPTSVQRIA